MKFILPFLIFLSACSDTLVQDPDDDQNGDVDYCEAFGWYGDGRCDTDCAKPDPDCKNGLPICETEPTVFASKDNACDSLNFQCENGTQYYADECGECGCVGEDICRRNPDITYDDLTLEECREFDENNSINCGVGSEYTVDACGCGCLLVCEFNPEVDYVAYGDGCQLVDFVCQDGTDYYNDDCGCGCIPVQEPQCEYNEPGVEWFSADPEVCSQENLQRECPFDTTYFENDCGCGCAPVSNCETDRDCPNGYCEQQLEQPTCISNNCGDGSQILCDAIPPTCPAGQVASEQDGCWGPCVSARTCEFVCETNNDCRREGLGPVCIAPACPAVEGVVCENYCGR